MAHSIQCEKCVFFQGDFKCDAFPSGIPREIYSGDFDHTKEYKGDGGIRFKSFDKFLEEIDNAT